ncbi:MAG: adenosylmethionine--8-amino-7-oxononanoate transaminase [Bacteroidota bacterium]
MDNISDIDKQYVWHPFTPQMSKEKNINLVKGDGVYLIDENGNKYIDAFSSWWVNLHGHANPYIAKKIAEQATTLEHAVFAGFTHEPGAILAKRLLEHIPFHSKVFYSDNGSTAVEVALKMAFQFWHNQNNEKINVIAFENAYHGDTFGGMSVGARNQFNQAFSKLLFEVHHIPVPTKENKNVVIEAFKKLITHHQFSTFIFEPLVQGAAGMIIYDAETLDELIKIAQQNNIICIADEVMTGFGRTGKFFATDYLQNKPDIICLSKGITGGFMPFSATTCNTKIYEAYLTNDKYKTFFHGHSYTGNPLACAAALASLDLLENSETQNNIERITKKHNEFILGLQNNKAVNKANSLGTILSIEVKTTENTSYLNSLADVIPSFFLERGIIIRPLGNVIYCIPPYCINDEELEQIYKAILEFLEA